MNGNHTPCSYLYRQLASQMTKQNALLCPFQVPVLQHCTTAVAKPVASQLFFRADPDSRDCQTVGKPSHFPHDTGKPCTDHVQQPLGPVAIIMRPPMHAKEPGGQTTRGSKNKGLCYFLMEFDMCKLPLRLSVIYLQWCHVLLLLLLLLLLRFAGADFPGLDIKLSRSHLLPQHSCPLLSNASCKMYNYKEPYVHTYLPHSSRLLASVSTTQNNCTTQGI